MPPTPVRLRQGRAASPVLGPLVEDAVRAAYADAAGPDLAAALDLAVLLGRTLPLPAGGDTVGLWEALATLGAVDLTVARVVEPHLDALAVLAEAAAAGSVAPDAPDDATWGVYAAEGPHRLQARQTPDGWVLDGEKSWCSLADHVDHALVTAWVDETRRGLFAVDLGAAGVARQATGGWVARGLAAVRSTGLRLDAVPATPVGDPDWYLTRPGFAWGGAGVAAVWFGGAVGVARRLRESAGRREPDQLALTHLGAVDAVLDGARGALAAAADLADTRPDAARADLVATRVRQQVADATTEVLDRTGRALGPGPLATEEPHARRVADLGLYLRQHHAERDLARLGSLVLAAAPDVERWW
ncbi:acyl-CoA dehydrogenase [Marmoricola sp. Leaf446]|uniref:acyl-CoA dehydrogenase n=1 Tax=Marmoricola sp. Leaf446 TaxID=1736379 RepID=UPI000AAD1B18|nr:acyl-CoA dehydrogenase [Marmoricola sp. Leaf446]